VAIEAVEQHHDHVFGMRGGVLNLKIFLAIHAPTLRTPPCGIVRCSYEQ
jgi:hypothetical protein